ncbi:MAG: hypothetical protein ABI054_02555 [Planctomycetota bacterium]
MALPLLALLAADCSSPEIVRADSVELPRDDAPRMSNLEGAAHGFPALRTLDGETLGDGDFRQWIEDGKLQVRLRYDLAPGAWIEERSVLQQEPTLVQEHWSWTEMRDEKVRRKFEVDFLTGDATAEKLEKGEMHRWSKHLKVTPGETFAGFAWALVLRAHRDELLRGEKIRLQAVGFTPKPTAATVELSWRGLEQVPMSGRTVAADHFQVHPRVPWIARAFIEAPDSQIWLTNPPPAAFLRFEGALAEPADPIIRVDLLPGVASRN